MCLWILTKDGEREKHTKINGSTCDADGRLYVHHQDSKKDYCSVIMAVLSLLIQAISFSPLLFALMGFGVDQLDHFTIKDPTITSSNTR